MKKLYVLDTNIIICDPNLEDYKGKTCYIPICVMKELDKHKSGLGETAWKSRLFHRKLKEVDKEELENNISYDYKGVTILNPTEDLEGVEEGTVVEYADQWFIASTFLNKSSDVIAHTSDFSLYNLMRLNNRSVEFINNTKVVSNLSLLYKGHRQVYVSNYLINDLYKEVSIDISDISEDLEELNENECVTLKSFDETQSAMAIYKKGKLKLVKVDKNKAYWGLTPISEEQKYAIHLLTDDRIRIVSLTGEAGSSKTILSFAVGLEKCVNFFGKGKLYIAKPPVSLSKRMALGFKKGTTLDKAIGSLGSYATNLERLSSLKGEHRKLDGSKMLIDMMEQCNVTYLNLEDVLGMSFSDEDYIIIDEAELLTKDEMKAVLTRGGKQIIIGDINQQCDEKIDADNSGLLHLIEVGKSSELIAHLTLQKCYRSEMVEEINRIW